MTKQSVVRAMPVAVADRGSEAIGEWVGKARGGASAFRAGPRHIGQERLDRKRPAVGQAEILRRHEGADFLGTHVVEQEPAGRGPGDRHLDADVGGDAEEAAAVAAVDDDIFVALETAELGRRVRLGGQTLHQFADAAEERVCVRIGASEQMRGAAEIDMPVRAARLQNVGFDEP